MNFRMTSFEEILNYFKLEGNIIICDRAMKLDALGSFVPLLYICPLASIFYCRSSPEL